MKSESATSSPSTFQAKVLPALKVGAISGIAGFASGGITAALRSNPTVGLFALGSGYHWFLLGSVYWAYAGLVLTFVVEGYREQLLSSTKTLYPSYRLETPRDRIAISGVAGSLTGATVGFILRGRRNVIPGAIMWGLLGAGGQWAYSIADENHSAEVFEKPASQQSQKRGFWDVVFRSEWSPVKRLTEDEYIHMLERRLLVVEADIALVDEEIAALKTAPRSEKTENGEK
ncbi:hypothetical protein DFH27DRAFT_619493 [Peziza echinospora]|nr:hypothetical protein DFH27DRAFT_619493 [Peziza echinospora]